MRNAFCRMLRQQTSLLAGLAAAALLAAPNLAVAQSDPTGPQTFVALGFVTVPGSPLTSFDISWVDTDLNIYLLADRSNASIDVVPLQVNPPVFKITPTAPNAFAGNVTTCPIANACNGPNGILTLKNPNGSVKELWVGDGPTPNPVCATTCSTVKVFNAAPTLTHIIPTGGSFRADELCFVPPGTYPNTGTLAHGLVQIANDSDSPPYINFIPTDGPGAYTVVNQIQFPTATNGIEQCQFDPNTGFIYLNIPEVSGPGNDTVPGEVVVIDPVTQTVVLTWSVPIADCAGPQGMAIGPAATGNILLGCNAPTIPSGVNNSVTISATGGGVTGTLLGQGGSDEVWFEPVSNNYFLANGSLLPAQQLGITDALTNAQVQNIFVGFTGGTTRRSHSVAAWSGSPLGLGNSITAAILPVSATGGTPLPPFSSTLCGGAAAQGCLAFFGAIPIPAE